MIIPIIVLFGLPGILLLLDFIKFTITQKSFYPLWLTRILELVVLIGFPLLYLCLFDGDQNDCCNESATFSPDHKLTIYVLISVCLLAYFYSSLKNTLSTPVLEVLTNSILLLGAIFNIFVAIQVEAPFWSFGNVAIELLFITQLIKNHLRFLTLNQNASSDATNYFEKVAWKILRLNPILKIPLLFILCLPILTITTSLLLLFGQKPDSLVRAFTDTYKHGLSQLDYLCNNVECGGHFLCSVAANGHEKIVKPIRYGERDGGKIICNRQLLVANAFEELIEQRLPKIHKTLRRNYNKVGNAIHRYHHFFNNKFVADVVYIFMKPLEILFLITLYTCDCKPENRIGQQYLSRAHRVALYEARNV